VLGFDISARTNRFLRLFGVWLFEGNHGRLRKDFGQFGIFFDGCPMPTNGVEAASQSRMVCEDTRGSFTFLFFFVLK
jgi:hypothetical protein